MISETREPIPIRPGRPARYDAVYKREGVRKVFMIFTPPRGWRRVAIREHKAAVDWSELIAEVLETITRRPDESAW